MSPTAAIICTRNRPDALRSTLTSIADQDILPPPTIILVDASDESAFCQNQRTVARSTTYPIVHHRYEGLPSAARQRNLGLRLLSDSTEIVFFLDDDITLKAGCLRYLVNGLESEPDLCGVGAIELNASGLPFGPASSRAAFWKYLFLLDHPRPGRVLPSGHISTYATLPRRRVDQQLLRTQWLSTCCCAYRRSVLDEVQFDEALYGALFEDRDLSYRIAQIGLLAVVPHARFIHHRSPINRRSALQFAYDRAVQRYWFVEKNICHPFRKPAFWWATLGHMLAVLASPKDCKWAALQGLLKGIRAILTRAHPLLHRR